jgi:hypothetical protein
MCHDSTVSKSNDHMMFRKFPRSRVRKICWVNSVQSARTITVTVTLVQVTIFTCVTWYSLVHLPKSCHLRAFIGKLSAHWALSAQSSVCGPNNARRDNAMTTSTSCAMPTTSRPLNLNPTVLCRPWCQSLLDRLLQSFPYSLHRVITSHVNHSFWTPESSEKDLEQRRTL